MSDLILYTSEDGKSQIQLRVDLGTVWLSQLELAELFDATKENISQNLKNIFHASELDATATVKKSLTAQSEGTRKVQRSVTLCSFEAILRGAGSVSHAAWSNSWSRRIRTLTSAAGAKKPALRTRKMKPI